VKWVELSNVKKKEFGVNNDAANLFVLVVLVFRQSLDHWFVVEHLNSLIEKRCNQ